MIVVVSMHHSGTHFVLEHLLADYPRIGNEIGEAVPAKFKVHKHCEPENVNALEWWLQRYPCIVPLRHPAKMVASWATRDGKPMAELKRQYAMLEFLDQRYRLNYLPLDTLHRERDLYDLNAALDTDFRTDWRVVMSNGKSAILDAEQLGMVDELLCLNLNQRFYAREDHVFCKDTAITQSTSCNTAAA